MFRTRIAVVATIVGLTLGTFGAGAALADSPLTTGHDRACGAHGQNHGGAVANGLECTPPSGLVTITSVPWYGGEVCNTTITATGLAPGTDLHVSRYQILVTADAEGNASWNGLLSHEPYKRWPIEVVVTGTTASGDPISDTFLIEC